MNKSPENPRQLLPSVHAALEHPGVRPLCDEHGRAVVAAWLRDELQQMRDRLETGRPAADRALLLDEIADRLARRAKDSQRTRLGNVINATGVILHTGLGRAPLSVAARSAIQEAASAGNLEFDLQSGARRYRGYQLLPAWQTLTGCEDALVVNNNAAATLLTLQGLCRGREVIISRGQLIEIGGSFRLPEIFELSGARLREVGTTNRTRLSDYEGAVGPETVAIMRVHPSNYRVVGFADAPETGPLAELAHKHGLMCIDDIGSGCLVDVTEFGLPKEPTFTESLAGGADLVLGSGDKLLGGPQAGIILGKSHLIEPLRKHPLARTLRVDKLTLAALSATLDAYLLENAESHIPTLSMLSASLDDLMRRARAIQGELGVGSGLTAEVREDRALVGGGSLPGVELPTAVLALQHAELTADALASRLRMGSIPLVPRVSDDEVFVDLRSVLPDDDSRVALALRLLAGQDREPPRS